jgi:diguanylate cyclase (GGDEF)-like protein
MIDIDHFKNVNDTYGHLVGDNVLINLARLVSENIRESDIFARWGGEEFILLLPNVDVSLAEKIVTELRLKIQLKEFEKVGYLTCSFGLTEYVRGDDINSITKRADDALYEAKESGRNRVCIR